MLYFADDSQIYLISKIINILYFYKLTEKKIKKKKEVFSLINNLLTKKKQNLFQHFIISNIFIHTSSLRDIEKHR